MVGEVGQPPLSSVGFLLDISPKSKVFCDPYSLGSDITKKEKKDGRAYRYEYWTGHTSVTPPLPGRGWAGRGFQGRAQENPRTASL